MFLGLENAKQWFEDRIDDFKTGAAILLSKNISQSGKGYQRPSASEQDAYYRNKAGLPKDKNSFKNWINKQNRNQKFERTRNAQKRGGKDKDGPDPNNPTNPYNLPPNPYLGGGGSDNNISPVTVGGGAVIITVLWWAAKALSPACGPGAPACAVAF